MDKKQKIVVTKNGPYSVSGNVPLKAEKIVKDADGFPCRWQTSKKYPVQEKYDLCRCGHSKTKPYCDKSHLETDFDGQETANNVPFDEQAETINGPELILKDLPSLCVHAGFCDRAGGTWDLTENSNDPTSKKTAIKETGDCPSGRLVIIDKKTGKPIEPVFEGSISATTNAEGVLGPLWVKGGIPVESSDGKTYEVRNRVTLCQCGKSKNKPFCDGSHLY